MKHLKHLFTVLLLLCSVTVNAHDFEVNGIYYDITNATNKTVAVTCRGSSYSEYDNEYAGSVTIPESVTYSGTTYSVTSIGNYAFKDCSGLTSIEIGNNVTSIGNEAFYGCSGLTSIEIPNSVTSIGVWAFAVCPGLISIEVESGNSTYDSRDNCNAIIETATNKLVKGCNSTIIPGSVTSIGNAAFDNCSGLTSIVIPNSVTSIGSSAFYNCVGLTSLVIGSGVTSIGNNAFFGCSGLTSIEIPNSVTSIGTYAFSQCSGLTSVVIGSGVTSIGNSAFSGCTGLTSIEIPSSVTSIGSSAFYNCVGLTSVVIGNSVTSFGNGAFLHCSELKTVVNFSSLTFEAGSSDYGNVAYYADKVINLSGNGSIIGNFVFTTADDVNTLVEYIGNETELVLPASYNGQDYTIGATAFAGNTSLTSLTIPAAVTAVEADAFLECTGLNAVYIDDLAAWCNIDFKDVVNSNPLNNAHNLYVNGELLTELVIPDGITEIKNATFRGCDKITSLTIPEGVTSIGQYAFNTCTALTEISFPESLTTLQRGAFSGCTALEVVVLPASVTELEYSVFMYCSNLVDITSLATTPPAVVNGSFTNIASNATLYVPRGSVAAYAATEWNQIPNIVELAFNLVYKVNGEVYATERIDYGAVVTPVAAPSILGYIFLGWDDLPENMPRHDVEVNAVLEKNSDVITIGQYGTTVYTSQYALDFGEVEGLKAYAATGYDTATGEITMTRIKKVNAGVGIYLVGSANTTYAVPYIDYSTSHSLNMLVGVLKKSMVNAYSDDGQYANYKYTIKSGDKAPKFYQYGDGSSVSAGKAYLQIPIAWFGSMASETVGIRFDEGELTDIDEIESEVDAESVKTKTIYDLQGRAVDNPAHGIYIIDGKKVFIK